MGKIFIYLSCSALLFEQRTCVVACTAWSKKESSLIFLSSPTVLAIVDLAFLGEIFLHLERGCEDGNFIFVKIDFSSFGEACCSGVQSNSTQRKEQRAELYYSPFLPLLSFIVFSLGHGVLISIFAALLIVKKQSFSRERYLSRFLSFL